MDRKKNTSQTTNKQIGDKSNIIIIESSSSSPSHQFLGPPPYVHLPEGVAVDPSSVVLPDPALPHLVIDVDHQREWHSGRPPRESQWPRTRHIVGRRLIHQEGAQQCLKEQRVIHKRVGHSLLKQRPDPRLTNHQIGPLHDDDRDKVRCVRPRQCLVPKSQIAINKSIATYSVFKIPDNTECTEWRQYRIG